jgi:hypothetical protein
MKNLSKSVFICVTPHLQVPQVGAPADAGGVREPQSCVSFSNTRSPTSTRTRSPDVRLKLS